ncbi:prolipoprotein diacylglyceryl transferase [Tumebacillus permanentifrigoris]|uniref:Prolipoprotein diacylglyceryl transferase n=1 Tax=Tumebacillus permanentifrigoris TaxID=378543 RepID=A0A316D8M0_9BACL|nr:prolipoprotein diacylglyceryl transferase family protein [Tumebacillus permanentifrigoris]PWK06999.1 prolipoprotein diacylglyceryl transferase [Tumebacillus permanentifrigoris]
MTFPIYIHLGPLSIHPHFLFESLAYFIGFRVYLYTRNKERIPMEKSMYILLGMILGGALGSKALYWLEDPIATWNHLTDPFYLMEGKTIVGGLLGGLLGVELAKKLVGWNQRTGDDFTIPLIVGLSLGRIGCFLTGLDDHTYGTPTTWITGIDFGDGILRHPTQLYEIAFLWVLGAVLLVLKKRRFLPNGGIFQLFMLSYLLFRLGIDSIKPTLHPYWIFNNVQLAAIAGLIHYINLIRQWPRKGDNTCLKTGPTSSTN